MKIWLLAVTLLLYGGSLGAQQRSSDAEVLRYAKSLRVKALDQRLPQQQLESWLKTVGVLTAEWKVAPGCDMYQDAVHNDSPLCVKFSFKGPEATDGYGYVLVGRVGEGIIGKARFRSIVVGASLGGYRASADLTGLPRLLKQASSLPEADKKILTYAQGLDAAMLDSALTSQRLDNWLRLGPPQLDKIDWQVSYDCELKDPEEPAPLCVRVGVMRDDAIGGTCLIRIGTRADGPVDVPQLEYCMIGARRSEIGILVHTLSELPVALTRAQAPQD